MIRVKHSTGSDHYERKEKISYTSLWNSTLDTTGGIRFYDGDLEYVAEFLFGEQPDETLMISYPHCNKAGILLIADKIEDEIRAALVEVAIKDPSRKSVVMDLKESKVKVIERNDFSRYSAKAIPASELFTFDNEDPKKGFPMMYVYEKTTSPQYGDTFRVLARISRFCFPVANKVTNEGIRFTYMLANSFINMQFEIDVPNTTGIHFPTKSDCEIPSLLKTEALEEFLLKMNTDKLEMKDGKIVDDNPFEVGEDDDLDMPLFLLDGGDKTSTDHVKLRDFITRQIVDKSSFNLGDAFTLGLEQVLSMVPISGKIINAICDFPGLVQKMCIYQGVFHIVPLFGTTGSLAQILDVDESSIKMCTLENFPHNPITQ